MRLLIIGATGLVGQEVLRLALAHQQITDVVAPTRRALAAHAKVLNPVIDFERLPETAEWWAADAVVCALGTTIRQAGSQERFRRVDHDYVITTSQLARRAGTPAFALTSSVGADPNSGNFYLRVKGEVERDLIALGFPSLTIVRPSLLDPGSAKRQDSRPGESFMIPLARLLAPIIPKRYRAVRIEAVAAALLESVLQSRPGVTIIESGALHSRD